MKNKIFALVGPSGSGKTTLIRNLTKQTLQLQEAISLTTREPRMGEVDGGDYYFIDKQTFDKTPMYEKTFYAGNHYGLSKEEVDGILKKKSVIVAVDIKGLHILENNFGKENVISFFIYAPLRMLKERMIKRGDSKDRIEQRLKNIEDTYEYNHLQYCDYLCENTDLIALGKSLEKMKEIIISNIK